MKTPSSTEINDILFNNDRSQTEALARRAEAITRQFFGHAISLYAPLYLSNYCSSHCTYCGFSSHNPIPRLKLSPQEIAQEMKAISSTGIENILLLTGESYQATPLPYLKEAVATAHQYFSSISMEIHPLTTAEYRELFLSGVDGITIYQETYDPKRYQEVHLDGIKSNYEFRYQAPERIAAAGIRQLSLGILLGLADVATDLAALYAHLRQLEKNYPGVEYSLSFPRLRQVKGEILAPCPVDDATFVKIICLTRILFPRVGINLSTRETPRLRDHLLALGVTRVSAGSRTTVGGYADEATTDRAPQFDIADDRSVDEMIATLKEHHFDPVLTDWRTITND
jgi:2-iminoacetate synthase